MHGVVVLMFSQIVVKVIGLIYKLYLTNKEGFGDRGNAIYSSSFQIYALFLTISSIGVPNSISKLVSSKVAVGDNKGAYRVLKIAFALFGVLGFIGSSILYFGAEHIANVYLQIPEAEMTILALSPSVFLVSISSVLRGYFNGKENLSVTANSQSLEQIFKTLFTIILVEQIASISSSNTVLMSAAATLATTLATFSSAFYLYKYFVKRKKEVWQEVVSSKVHKKDGVFTVMKNILLISIPMALSALFSVATKTIDTVTVVRLLKSVVGEEIATLQYGILSGKVDTLITLPFSFNIAIATALVPTVSSAIARGEEYIAKRRIKFSILATILIGLPCTIFMCLFANQFLELLFPNASSGGKILQIASWSIIFVVLTQTANGALQGLGKVNISVMAFAVGAIIKFALNIILIPQIGINGASISSIISHIVTLIIVLKELKKSLNLRFEISKFIFRPIIISILMSISSYAVYINLKSFLEKKLLLFVSIITGLIVYIFSILLFKLLSKEEVFMIPFGKKIYNMFYKTSKQKRLKVSKIKHYKTRKCCKP